MSDIKKFRKKPVVIEAMRYAGNDVSRQEKYESAKAIIEWVGQYRGHAHSTDSSSGRRLYISTLEGNMEVSPGDYVLKGVKNEFYPCKPDILAETYDNVD